MVKLPIQTRMPGDKERARNGKCRDKAAALWSWRLVALARMVSANVRMVSMKVFDAGEAAAMDSQVVNDAQKFDHVQP